MILVTVGSTLFPFQRMATLVEHIAHIRKDTEKIIFQYGHTPPHFVDRKVLAVPFIPHARLMRHMKSARVILCHGGPATIYQALSFGKIPWVLPREHQYGEHINDHQVEYARFMAAHHRVRIITPQTPVMRLLETAHTILPVHANNPELIRFLDAVTLTGLPKRS